MALTLEHLTPSERKLLDKTEAKLARQIPGIVKRGVDLLDKKGLPSWARKIKLTRLELKNGELCVLGQLYGVPGQADYGQTGYDVGIDMLGLDETKAERLGFTLDFDALMQVEEHIEEGRRAGGARDEQTWLSTDVLKAIENRLWDRLTEAWKDAIRARRRGVTTP